MLLCSCLHAVHGRSGFAAVATDRKPQVPTELQSIATDSPVKSGSSDTLGVKDH